MIRPPLFLLIVTSALLGQQMPPSPVSYTQALQHRIEGQLRLPGTVEANVTSLVASEIGGLVVEHPVTVGDKVKEGQLLARLNKRSLELDLQAAEAELKEAEARQKLAERNFGRAEELFDSQVFSQQQLDDTKYELNAWQGRIDNLKAEIERINYDIERSTIGAPFDGVIIKKHTELGQWLAVGDPVAELLSLEDLDVVVDVPEQYYRSVREGGAARITFDAAPDQTVTGIIRSIIPKADVQARTFPVRVRMSGGSGKIAVGMLAQVRFSGLTSSRRSRTATVVPKDAIVRQGQRAMVWLLNGDGTVSPAPVQTGDAAGAWIEVQGPVAAGDQVIIRGNERLQPGQKVEGEIVEYTLP